MIKSKTKKYLYIGLGIIGISFLYFLKTNYFIRFFGFILVIYWFYLGDMIYGFKFEKVHYLIFIIVALFTILLGDLYAKYLVYDKILHFVVPIVIGLPIFSAVNRLNLKKSMKLGITFCIIVAIVASIEAGEYVLDFLFDFKLQGVYLRGSSSLVKLEAVQGKNIDTAIDLVLGVFGALISVLLTKVFYEYKKKIKKI